VATETEVLAEMRESTSRWGPSSYSESGQTLVNPRPSSDRPLVIGLLGGIAAGKSTVGRIFAEHGFRVLDADLVARDVVTEPDARAAILDRFGPGFFDASGELRRADLAELVFGDPTARRDLEAIVHPRVRERLLAGLAAARRAGESVVLDVPLLLENGLIDECHECVFLGADAAQRLVRARARGWGEGELDRREASQATLAAKRARCRFEVETGGSVADARRRVAEVIAELVAP
jgi:dephospho-CoA kinase